MVRHPHVREMKSFGMMLILLLNTRNQFRIQVTRKMSTCLRKGRETTVLGVAIGERRCVGDHYIEVRKFILWLPIDCEAERIEHHFHSAVIFSAPIGDPISFLVVYIDGGVGEDWRKVRAESSGLFQ